MLATLPASGTHQLMLTNNRRFTYSVRTIEIDNLLSTALVVLHEYVVEDLAGNRFILYRTRGGNWYDIPDINCGADAGLLATLKAAIDLRLRIAC